MYTSSGLGAMFQWVEHIVASVLKYKDELEISSTAIGKTITVARTTCKVDSKL